MNNYKTNKTSLFPFFSALMTSDKISHWFVTSTRLLLIESSLLGLAPIAFEKAFDCFTLHLFFLPVTPLHCGTLLLCQ